jgi:hypothetical protein
LVLCDSAKYYFEAEKAKYHPNHYTDGSEHLKQPARFREHLKVLGDLFDAGDGTPGKQLMGFLGHWWLRNIAPLDKKYAPLPLE